MDTTMTWLLVLFVFCCFMAFITSSMNANKKETTPIRFRHIEGMPNLKEGKVVEISKNKKSINIDNKISILNKNIKSKIITSSKELTEKQKSVLKRSLLGIVVAGPLGAIIGGMSGIGTKQKMELVYFLTIDYVDDCGIEKSSLFSLEDSSKLLNLTMFARC